STITISFTDSFATNQAIHDDSGKVIGIGTGTRIDKNPKSQTFNKTIYGISDFIFFSPELWDGTQGPATNTDEVLFHELIHATRDTRGVNIDANVNKDYINEEEYLAVVLTNIYVSNKGLKSLRKNYKTNELLVEKDWDKF